MAPSPGKTETEVKVRRRRRRKNRKRKRSKRKNEKEIFDKFDGKKIGQKFEYRRMSRFGFSAERSDEENGCRTIFRNFKSPKGDCYALSFRF